MIKADHLLSVADLWRVLTGANVVEPRQVAAPETRVEGWAVQRPSNQLVNQLAWSSSTGTKPAD